MRSKIRKISKESVNDNSADNDTNNSKKELTDEEINEINDEELEKFSKGKIIKKMILFFEKSFWKVSNAITIIFKGLGIYLLWICLHFFSSHLYIKFCVPKTFLGFIMSPFMISTPHCQGLRWIVYNAANIINNMWILIGTSIYSMIWIFNETKDSVNSL